MTSSNRANTWFAVDIIERDALGLQDGLRPGDFCLVDSVNLYVAQSATQTTSNWLPMAGVPTQGHYGLGARNEGAASSVVFVLTGITFRAVLDALPSSITIVPAGNFNWASTPVVTSMGTTGFRMSGSSGSISGGTNAWTQGTYTIQY